MDDGASVDTVSTVNTVVFDLGNVLVGWDPRAAFEGVVDPAVVEWFFGAADFPGVNRRMDAGLAVEEAAASLARQDPRFAELYLGYVERFPTSLTGPVTGSAELVHELRDRGVRLLGLTNWSAETFHHAVPAAPAIGLLEDVLVSGREGVIKPDPRIFELLLDRYGLDAARTVFVDDTEPNVAAAAALGIDAVLFTGADALRAELHGRGLVRATP